MVVYETISELMKERVKYITEDDSNYYVMLDMQPGEIYHDEIWVVNKRTKKVSFMSSITYAFEIHDYTRPVDITTFEKSLE